MRLLLAATAIALLDAAKARARLRHGALRPALDEIASLRAHVDGGACVPDLGAKADALLRVEEQIKRKRAATPYVATSKND